MLSFFGLYKAYFSFGPSTRPILLVLFGFVYFVYAFYFKSLYEEAVVLALSPWLLWGIADTSKTGRHWPSILLAAVILASKPQMIFVLPVLVAGIVQTRPGWNRQTGVVLLCAALIASIGALWSASQKSNRAANSYDRFYNGIGWTLQASSTWPASNFNERQSYFYSHADELQKSTDFLEPVAGVSLLGTSYRPTGTRVSEQASSSSGTEAARKLFGEVMGKGSLKNYVQFFQNHLSILLPYLHNIYATTLVSDYSLGYIVTYAPPSHPWKETMLASIHWGSRHIGILFYLLR